MNYRNIISRIVHELDYDLYKELFVYSDDNEDEINNLCNILKNEIKSYIPDYLQEKICTEYGISDYNCDPDYDSLVRKAINEL